MSATTVILSELNDENDDDDDDDDDNDDVTSGKWRQSHWRKWNMDQDSSY